MSGLDVEEIAGLSCVGCLGIGFLLIIIPFAVGLWRWALG